MPIASASAPGGVDLGSHLATSQEWWGNGGGYIFAVTALPMISSGLLMLRRVRYSRAVYLMTWIILGSGVVYCDGQTMQ